MIQVIKFCVCFYFPGRPRATGLVLRHRKQFTMFAVLSGQLTKVKTAISIVNSSGNVTASLYPRLRLLRRLAITFVSPFMWSIGM